MNGRHCIAAATLSLFLCGAAFAAKVNKPLIATETCWGALDDEKRVEIVRFTAGFRGSGDLLSGWHVLL